ncbi:hypothetical protein SEVIR_2G207900v4 [Setaria viridis]|nr:uncharacterized protein LOC101758854 [Setaria italica]XP_034579126.1 uncharacterized protein LOC117842732 [Setaria viridis]RCV11603.1 hypothetical protein SETIT_2G199600v2 [Setaria italica]TKW33048.1 hypothetical protein SEVIR_2G207900v2 [Setaria viridis]
MARSPFVPMEAREQAGTGGGAEAGKGQAPHQAREEEQEAAVLLVHSQVRRIKREDEEIRERLLKLRLLETRPAGGFVCDPVAWRASRSLSPLRRAGNGIPVGD